MDHNNPISGATDVERASLTRALTAFGERYFTELRRHPPDRRMPLLTPRWRRQRDDWFEPNTVKAVDLGEVTDWPEAKELLSVLMTGPWLQRHVSSRITEEQGKEAAYRPFLMMIAEDAVLSLEAIPGSTVESVRAALQPMVDLLCRTTEPTLVAVPLLGYEGPDVLELTPDISVRKATDHELGMLLDLQTLVIAHVWQRNSEGWPRGPRYLPRSVQWIVACDGSAPWAFANRDQTPAPGKASPQGARAVAPVADGDIARLIRHADAFVAAARMLIPGRIVRGPVVTTRGGLLRSSAASHEGNPPAPSVEGHVIVATEAAVPVVTLSLAILACPTRFAHGVRRYVASCERSDRQDALVDLVIALESLVGDGGDSLTYKAARRASALVNPSAFTPGQVRTFIAKAYGTRSDIVHGRKSTSYDLAGQSCTLEEQLRQLDRILGAIFAKVFLQPPPGEVAAYADALIDAALSSPR